MKYLVRVTRYTEDETVDLEIEADDWETAKSMAIEDAQANASTYFSPETIAEYAVVGLDDDEEASALED